MTNKVYKGEAMRLLLIFTLLTSLSACSNGWDKDPLAAEADNIKNSVKPKEKVTLIPPPQGDVIFTQLSQVYLVKQGEELEIAVDWTSVHDEVTVESVEIGNLAEAFPNSSFDTTTNTIKLRPGYDVVPVDANYVIKEIEVLFNKSYKGETQIETRTIAIHVVPEESKPPEIEEFGYKKIPSGLMSGSTYTFQFDVKDVSSDYSPRIVVYDSWSAAHTGSQFIKVNNSGVQSEIDPNIWTFTAEIKLPIDMNVSTPGKRFSVELIAYSIKGIPSRGESLSLNVYAGANKPTFLKNPRIVFDQGKENKYIFAAVDTLNRGSLSGDCQLKLAGVNCRCTSTAIGRPMQCYVEGNPKIKGIFKANLTARAKVRQGFGLPDEIAVTNDSIEIIVK